MFASRARDFENGPVVPRPYAHRIKPHKIAVKVSSNHGNGQRRINVATKNLRGVEVQLSACNANDSVMFVIWCMYVLC
jgi:hypothetical protein